MSWLWQNETTEQAQVVVTALQSELDARDAKIKVLERDLRQENQDFKDFLRVEIDELMQRKQMIESELQEVDALIQEKQKMLSLASTSAKKAKKKKKHATKGGAATSATATASASASGSNDTSVAIAGAATDSTSEQANSTARTTAVTTKQEEPSSEQTVVSPKSKTTRTRTKSKSKHKATSGDGKPNYLALPRDEHLDKVIDIDSNTCFIIQRSLNSNTVIYAAAFDASNSSKTLHASKPLEVYWIMYEKNGNPREELNMIERNSAYGISTAPSKTNPREYIVTLSALRDRKAVLFLDENGTPHIKTTINGQQGMILYRVYVKTTTGWVPSVEYVELFGVDPTTGERVYEKKLP